MSLEKKKAKRQIEVLVDRFREHAETYKQDTYKEHQARIDFIDPFFKALGWDVNNEQGLAESYREVIHEDRIKIGKTIKAPDYCFTSFGHRKFFVDAKKPSVNIYSDKHPAFQVRRYGWSANLTVSIATDFEEFAIYDCTKKPKENDKAVTCRIKYIRYDQYIENFDFLWNTFSKEAIVEGRFDKFVLLDRHKKGTETVDNEFLKSIEIWRSYLAKNLVLRNKSLSEDEVNQAVQTTIDRILFLRICEDRRIEPFGNLKKAIEKGNTYASLYDLYKNADDKYNSGLFDLKSDLLTRNLTLDDKTLKSIVAELYYPNCQYEFSVMPADILGSVYERFLGKTISISKANRVTIEDKPEIKKSGGVFYTPKFVVDHIVEYTLGKSLENKTPKQIEKIKVCDPACGSGSFLIGAYQFLLDWHLNFYVKSKKKNVPLTPYGNLTTAEKKKILINNIYGVDIDPQAVEVTKLNLLLKALEGETNESINHQMQLFHEKVLPNLSQNIKCGNSLIDHSFYDGQDDLFPEILKKINAFNWHQEFPKVFSDGGFDCVIGNPPYVDVKILSKEIKDELIRTYESADSRFDLYVPFVEKGLDISRPNGFVSYILPSMFSRRDYGKSLRRVISKKSTISEIVDFGTNQVFQTATNYVSIYTLKKSSKTKANTAVIRFEGSGLSPQELKYSLNFEDGVKRISVSKSVFSVETEWYLLTDNERNLFNRLTKDFGKLGSHLEFASEGIHSGKDEVFFIPKEKAIELNLETPPIRPLAKGKDIHRYDSINDKNFKHVVLYPYDINSGKVYSQEWLDKNAPNCLKYLLKCKKNLSGRGYFEKSNKVWYELWCQRNPNLYTRQNIVGPEIANKGEFTLSESDLFINNKLKSLVLKTSEGLDIRYFLGLLNSKLLVFYHRLIAPPKDNGYFEVKTGFLKTLPIKEINFSLQGEKTDYDNILKCVSNILKLKGILPVQKTQSSIRQTESAILHLEREIDGSVYSLYNLTSREVKIVEAQSIN